MYKYQNIGQSFYHGGGTMENRLRQTTGEICLVCEETRLKGIHICDRFMCNECERKVIETDTGHVNYQYYLEKLRKLRLSRLA